MEASKAIRGRSSSEGANLSGINYSETVLRKQGWYYVESLTGQRHDRSPNWKPNCNRGQLFRPWWVSSARCSKLWSIQLVDWYSQTHYMQMVMTSDETQIQILANWPMSHAKRVTRETKGQQEKSRILCRWKETADRHKLSRRKIMAEHWRI